MQLIHLWLVIKSWSTLAVFHQFLFVFSLVPLPLDSPLLTLFLLLLLYDSATKLSAFFIFFQILSHSWISAIPPHSLSYFNTRHLFHYKFKFKLSPPLSSFSFFFPFIYTHAKYSNSFIIHATLFINYNCWFIELKTYLIVISLIKCVVNDDFDLREPISLPFLTCVWAIIIANSGASITAVEL